MLSKLTSKNQITLPKKVMLHFANTEYFEVEEQQGKIILTPVTLSRTEAIREKLALLNIDEKDIKAAIRWSRNQN